MDAQLLPAPVADEVLDRLAAELNELARHRGLQFHLELGRRVLTALYDDDLGQWRERGTADTSLRRLARRDDLRISKSVLHRSLHVVEVYERLGRPDWRHLGVSHVAEVDSKSGLQDLDRVRELDRDQREDLRAIANSLRERADAIERALSDR